MAYFEESTVKSDKESFILENAMTKLNNLGLKRELMY
jgi:hypothetical protein